VLFHLLWLLGGRLQLQVVVLLVAAAVTAHQDSQALVVQVAAAQAQQ
jgi:hypothetical protein